MNNKIIKFRVWNSNRNIFIFKGTLIELINSHDNDLEFPILINESGNIFQQFTGRLDINSKEIYEGDIANVSEGFNGYHDCIGKNEVKIVHYNSIIEFNRNTLAYMYSIQRSKMPPLSHQMLSFAKKIEVVGNIFENSELLI